VSVLCLDDCQDAADFRLFALLHDDLAEDAGGRGLQFLGGLFGLDLRNRLVLGDLVTDFFSTP